LHKAYKGMNAFHRPTNLDLGQPYLRSLNPARASLVPRTLGQLELINREGSILAVTELGVCG
jgi:hypothetical protein